VATVDSKVAVAGPTGIGKTNVFLRLSRHLCEATPFLGLPIPEPRRVLYVALEGGRRGFRRRLGKVWQGASPEARARFHLAHLTLNLVDDADLDRLDALLYDVGPDILIIDPLRNAHQLDENTSHDMARLTAILDGLIDRHHCALFLAHHDRKKPAFVRRDAGIDRVRGSTALAGWLTACLSLDADPSGPDMLIAEWVKTRDSEVLLPPLVLEFNREALDFTASERAAGGKLPDEAIINAIFHSGGRIKGTDLIRGLVEGAGASERWVRERLRNLVSSGEVLAYVADPKTNAKGYALPQEADIED
jgi:hypothetical protein